ncbi:hypothetical protein QYF61_021464 [Mycteria americana]|uniref:Uncharacterized protein n=1 Tax=Mycteria americana TaxID=33587 RepID=A0AAN7N0W4_MYCAM|nr:hypothetical protein QYF61_021464 [Mycteria americana]
MVEGVEGVSCEEQLRIPGLVSLDKRRLRGHLIAVYNFLVMGNAEGGAALFSQVSGDREWLKVASGGSSEWPLGKSSSWQGWSSTGTSSPGMRSWPQACWVFKKSMEKALRCRTWRNITLAAQEQIERRKPGLAEDLTVWDS